MNSPSRLGYAGRRLILVLYKEGAMHGYAAKKAVEALPGGALSTAGVYSALGRLVEMGLVELVDDQPMQSTKGPPKKVYRLTGEGERAAREVLGEYEAALAGMLRPLPHPSFV